MKKLSFIAVIMTVMILMLTACAASPYTAVMCIENKNSNGWDMSYQKINGKKTEKFTAKEGGCLLSCAITTKSGTLQVDVCKEDGTVLYSSGVINTDNTFDYEVKDEGKYYLQLAADNHSGSIEVTYAQLGEQNS